MGVNMSKSYCVEAEILEKGIAEEFKKWEEIYKYYKNADKDLYSIGKKDFKTTEHLVSKLWIIGRSYMTQLERHFDKKKVINNKPKILGFAKAIGKQDQRELLNYLNKIKNVESVKLATKVVGGKIKVTINDSEFKKMELVFKCLVLFVDLLCKTGWIRVKSKTPTSYLSLVSFSSKILHFYNPLIPIFDSLAFKNIGKVIKLTKNKGISKGYLEMLDDKFNIKVIHKREYIPIGKRLFWIDKKKKDYERYIFKFFVLCSVLRKNPRLVDFYLYSK